MEPSTASAAPAQPDAPPLAISAIDRAIATGDQSALREARRAAQSGKPLPDVPVTEDPDQPADSPAAAPVAEPEKLSRRERDQQAANERTRKAVEAATADLRAEVARLTASTKVEPPKPAAGPVKVEDWRRFAAMPNAPKLADFASSEDPIHDHAAAMALFIADTRHAERQTAERDSAALSAHREQLIARDVKFGERFQAAIAADPELHAKIPPAFHDPDVVPLSALPPGAPMKFAHLVAEVAFDSEQPAELLKYLHAHPDETKAIAALPFQSAMNALARLDGRLAGPVSAASSTAQPKFTSDAPEPAHTLGTRPTPPTDDIDTAVHRGDQAAFKAARLRRRAAGQSR